MSDLEAEYVGFTTAAELRETSARWSREAAAYREAARAELDVPYGEAPRQRLDIFRPASAPVDARGEATPVALFIHGGYWQMRDKSTFSHVARGANARGITVAIAGYTLCPEATLATIVDELAQAVIFVARRFGAPVTVYGHSAGGHLAACMLATDFHALDPALDERVVPAALPVSGLFELEPLVATSLNKALRLDAGEARRLSPLFWQAPTGKALKAYVGAAETPAFLRQTRMLVARWHAEGVAAAAVEIDGAGHFAALDALADPESDPVRDLAAFTRG
jgi:arylformamidase